MYRYTEQLERAANGRASTSSFLARNPLNIRCGLLNHICYPKQESPVAADDNNVRGCKGKQHNHLHQRKKICPGWDLTQRHSPPTELPGQLSRQASNLQLNTMQRKAKASLENSVLWHRNLSLRMRRRHMHKCRRNAHAQIFQKRRMRKKDNALELRREDDIHWITPPQQRYSSSSSL